jgi:hypothetical protein
MILCVLLFFENDNKRIKIKILSDDLKKLEQEIENKTDIVECEKEIEYQVKMINKELQPLNFTELDYYIDEVYSCDLDNYFNELVEIRDNFVYEFIDMPNSQPYIQLKINNSIDGIIENLKENNCVN